MESLCICWARKAQDANRDLYIQSKEEEIARGNMLRTYKWSWRSSMQACIEPWWNSQVTSGIWICQWDKESYPFSYHEKKRQHCTEQFSNLSRKSTLYSPCWSWPWYLQQKIKLPEIENPKRWMKSGKAVGWKGTPIITMVSDKGDFVQTRKASSEWLISKICWVELISG